MGTGDGEDHSVEEDVNGHDGAGAEMDVGVDKGNDDGGNAGGQRRAR